MRERVPSRFNSGVVTLNTKYEQPIQNHDFSEIKLKIDGSCYKPSLKNIILSNINRLYG